VRRRGGNAVGERPLPKPQFFELMNARNYPPAKLLLALMGALAGWGGVQAQLILPDWPPPLGAGPYATGTNPENGSTAVDEPIPGFVGPAGDGVAPYAGQNVEQSVNPAFVEWASSVINYSPADPDVIDSYFLDPTTALGPVTGNVFDVVSLGDLSTADIAAGAVPGSITLGFATPVADGPGPDFVVFGNAFTVRGQATQVFSKLAYVEVSSDGVNFARFPSVDTNPKPVQPTWSYMVSNPTLIYNLFGKAVNAYGVSWGVPFDLAQLSQHPLVAAGLLDLQNVRYVRLVAVVGNGVYSTDAYGNPIYDPWPTTGSPGPEVQAVGVLNLAPPPSPPAASSTATSVLANFAPSGGSNLPVSASGVKASHSTPSATPHPASVAARGLLGFVTSLPDYGSSTPGAVSSPSLGATAIAAGNGVVGSNNANPPVAASGVDSAPADGPEATKSALLSEPAANQAGETANDPGAENANKDSSARPSTGTVSVPSPSDAMGGFSTGWRLKTTILTLAFIGGLAWWKRLAR
jgi:hypothetical protein